MAALNWGLDLDIPTVVIFVPLTVYVFCLTASTFFLLRKLKEESKKEGDIHLKL